MFKNIRYLYSTVTTLNNDLKVNNRWSVIGSVTGTEKLYIDDTIRNTYCELSYTISFVPPGSNKELVFMVTGCGSNTNKTYMTGFYYSSSYYGSLGIESNLGSNNYVNISPRSSWTRVVINGTEMSVDDMVLHAYYRR